MKNWKFIVIGIVAGLVLSGIFSSFSGLGKKGSKAGGQDAANSGPQEKKIKYWTCSMHPQIKLPKPGFGPICGMKLIPVYESSEDQDEGSEVSLTLNETGRRLAEIETEEVKYRTVSHKVRLVGKVDYDETKVFYISAWVPGRIDRLYVDFTGTKVRKDDHLIKLYSPELIATQEEYIQAIKNLEDVQNSQSSIILETSQTTLKNAREKLRLYGINDEQIKETAQRGAPEDHLTITSPVTGTVIHKTGFEGMYVKTGDKIYTIADLSRVWLYLDAYESDIQWLHYGQSVAIETESFPGEKFYGKIAFIDPFVNEKTRTIKLRVNVENKNEKLKPGMFVRASIKSVLGNGGKIYEESLAGKWICPMHPDFVKDRPGRCDICDMTLIKTSEFGFTDKPSDQTKALVIPKAAPLITGKRAVVYVENINDKTGRHRYEGREVVLGPRAGNYYVVLSGVKPGEKVVTKGNFKIDSALQIEAKPSMMNPAGYYNEEEPVMTQGVPKITGNADILASALPYYLSVSKALAGDNAKDAADNFKKFKKAINTLIKENFDDADGEGIAGDVLLLSKKMNVIHDDLDSLRKSLAEVSEVLKNILKKYPYTGNLKMYLNFCPMERAWWLQDSGKVNNPYYGTEMSECGEAKAEYGRKIKKSMPMKGHAGHKM